MVDTSTFGGKGPCASSSRNRLRGSSCHDEVDHRPSVTTPASALHVPRTGGAHHDQLADPRMATQLLDVIEADQAAHRVADDVDLLRRGLGQDPLDLAVDEERGPADIVGR